MSTEPRRLDLSPYLRRQPVTLALLTALMVVFFLAVTALARVHDSQRESLAERWAQRGVDSLNTGKYRPAVEDFRTALLYSRDNGAYQLSLAEALMGLKRDDEAQAYLVNLWEREPDNGMVSLELARVAVSKNQTEQALRYYHNAIYGTWPSDSDINRRRTRLELIAYLMRIDARPQAEAEMIDLAATVGDNAAEQEQMGEMFAKVGDDRRALAAFRTSLSLKRHDAAALAGAGTAAFRLGQYGEAERYLQQALVANPGDTAAAQHLKLNEYVLHWDPFRQGVRQRQQNQIALAAFTAAGARLRSCTAPTAPQQEDEQQWATLKPQMTVRGLEATPDLVNTAMKLAFQIEKETAGTCGAQTDADQALLLVASLHEEE